MKRLGIIIAVLAMLWTVSCGDREYIHGEKEGLISFKFFLFVSIDGDMKQANGDAALERDRFFKFRLYDNLLGIHVFDYVSSADGGNEIVYPDDKLVLYKMDKPLSKILAGYLYWFFVPTDESVLKSALLSGYQFVSNRVERIKLKYSGQDFMISVESRQKDGDPLSIKIENERDFFVFDIVSYTNLDFAVEKANFKVITNQSAQSVFEWLGRAYGKK